MGKQGPCYHCGVTSTPLWRNGPPEKPILCNACGSRWRTKGTLTNYTPLHARPDIVDFEGFRDSKAKAITIKTNEQKSEKRKQYDGNMDVEGEAPDSDLNFQKAFEHTSNRSSSGSAMLYSESCAHFCCTDMGSTQSNVRESLVPSRKRTCISLPKPSIQKLTKELCCILHEQQSSNLFGSSEDDLIFESETPLVSVEIGHGGVLIRHPNSVVREEESEASSLAIDNKVCIVNDAYSGLMSHSEHVESKGMSLQNFGDEQDKKPTGQEAAQDHMKRSKFSHGELHILQNSKSPLGSIDLRDVVSFEEFVRHLTCEEQKQLMKYLPYSDNEKLECLQSMFNSPQFVDTLLSFQQLLLKGIFYPSFHGENTEEYRVLKRLALVNLTKSKWVEYYQLLKDAKKNKGKGGKEVSTETSFPGCGNLAPTRRPHDVHSQNFPERKGTIKSHNRVLKCGNMNLPSTKSSQLNSSKADIRESYDDMNDNASSCISLRSLFAFPPDRSSVMLDSLRFTEESSDQDFLFDVPLSASFP